MMALRPDPPQLGLPPWDPDQEAEFWVSSASAPSGEDEAPPARHCATRWSRRIAWAGGISLVLHGAILATLLLPRHQDAPSGAPPKLEVELVEEAPMQRGDASAAPAPAQEQVAEAEASPPPQPSVAQPSPEPSKPAAPPMELGHGGVPMPQPYRPPPPQPQAPQPQAAPSRQTARADAPQVNLGDEEDREAYRVSGDDVVPPQPDAARRNLPPRYPQDAAHRGAQGTVQLRVRVTERGQPITVVVDRSSGDQSLDRSAMEAVRRWHFTPATRGGVAVPFDYQISIRFVIGNG